MNQYETFYAEIKEVNKVRKLTIPNDLCKYAGFKTGDWVKVMISKKDETDERML